MMVSFRYGATTIHPHSRVLKISSADQVFERDLNAEQVLLSQLGRLGMVPFEKLFANKSHRLPNVHHQIVSSTWIHKDAAKLSVGNLVQIPLTTLAQLSQVGWKVEGNKNLPEIPIIDIDEWTVEVDSEEGNDWFQLHLGVVIGGQRVDAAPLIADLLSHGVKGMADLPRQVDNSRVMVLCPRPDGKMIRIEESTLIRMIEHLTDLFAGVEKTKEGALRIPLSRALLLEDLGVLGARWVGGERLRNLAKALADPQGIAIAPPPRGLVAALRPYQLIGLSWLQFLGQHRLGGILADDMGLGKTVQAIAHILCEHEAGRLKAPVLIVCPASVLGNWQRELARFAPSLTCLPLYGTERSEAFDSIKKFHTVVTTYQTLRNDVEILEKLEFSLFIVDEAQMVKNAAAKTTQAMRQIKAAQVICLSGTPLENHLGELWSLMHLSVPGLLGGHEEFNRTLRKPIEKDKDAGARLRLARRVQPFLLRRTKEVVAKELPTKTEIVLPVDLHPGQRTLYESIRIAMDDKVREAIKERGLARSHFVVLEALLRLRQTCCDPRLINTKAAAKAGPSAKLEALVELVQELSDEGRRMLIFSQFTSMLDLIETELSTMDIKFVRLDGSTRDRQAVVDRFQSGEVPVFLLSLKAGGTGLNLTAADCVIHYDPWWNPAVERQATDRAHRIGQVKPVFVYKLVAAGTVEERIQELQARKAQLLSGLLDDDGQSLPAFNQDDLEELMKPVS